MSASSEESKQCDYALRALHIQWLVLHWINNVRPPLPPVTLNCKALVLFQSLRFMALLRLRLTLCKQWRGLSDERWNLKKSNYLQIKCLTQWPGWLRTYTGKQAVNINAHCINRLYTVFPMFAVRVLNHSTDLCAKIWGKDLTTLQRETQQLSLSSS